MKKWYAKYNKTFGKWEATDGFCHDYSDTKEEAERIVALMNGRTDCKKCKAGKAGQCGGRRKDGRCAWSNEG